MLSGVDDIKIVFGGRCLPHVTAVMTYLLFRDNLPILRTGELRLQVQVNGVSLRCNNKWTKWGFVDVVVALMC